MRRAFRERTVLDAVMGAQAGSDGSATDAISWKLPDRKPWATTALTLIVSDLPGRRERAGSTSVHGLPTGARALGDSFTGVAWIGRCTVAMRPCSTAGPLLTMMTLVRKVLAVVAVPGVLMLMPTGSGGGQLLAAAATAPPRRRRQQDRVCIFRFVMSLCWLDKWVN